MSTRTSPWPAGMPCWADLATTDVDAASAFYSTVLGWTVEDQGEGYGGYAIASTAGGSAAGIGPAQAGMPVAWTLYLASDDADATAAAVTEHGGTVLVEPFDVRGLGRMLVAADPAGAVFGVWQAGEHVGAEVVNQPGALCWDDLRSTDPAAAVVFYRALFGYRVEALAEMGGEYQLFHLPCDDAPAGGMGGMFGAPEGIPSHWVVYFGVEDADATIASALDAGGSLAVPAFDTPYGRMAGLVDPFGAMFWVAQVDTSTQPDRSG